MIPLLVPALTGLVLVASDPGEGRIGALARWLGRAWSAPAMRAVNAAMLVALCVLPSPDNLGIQRYVLEHAGDPVRWLGFSDPRLVHRLPAPFVSPGAPAFTPLGTADDLRRELGSGAYPALVLGKFPLPPGAEELLRASGQRVFSTLPPWLARVNVGHWLDRADLYVVYRVDRPAQPR